MRIVAYTNLYMPMCRAGAQTMLRDLLRPLRQRHEITVVVNDGKGRTRPYQWEGIPVYPDPEQAEDLLRSADLLIAHLQGTAPAGKIAEECDIPLIQLLHAEEDGDRDYFRQHRCDLLVFNSYWMKKSVSKDYTGPSLVVYPPVQPGEYRTGPGESVTLVNVSDIKGSDVFYELAERYPAESFLGVRGGYAKQDLRDKPNVLLADAVDDMRVVYGRTKVLLMPSVYESFGRCAIEAAASGIPTIAAPTPGLREALGPSGFFCDTGDLDGWATTLGELLEPAAWSDAAEQSRQRSTDLAMETSEQLAHWCAVVDSYDRVRVAV